MGTVILHVKDRTGGFERVVGEEYVKGIYSPIIFTACSTSSVCKETRGRFAILY